MARLKDLGSIVKKKVDVIIAKNNEKAKDIAIEVLTHAVERTRIDTSKAKSNWQISLDQPKINEVPAVFLGSKGSTEAETESAVIDSARSIIRDKKPGQPIYITNNIEGYEYIDNAELIEAEQEARDLGLTLVEIGKTLAETRNA